MTKMAAMPIYDNDNDNDNDFIQQKHTTMLNAYKTYIQ